MKKTAGHIERTFAILELLKNETDENHRISMNEIIASLQEMGIPAERKSVYNSINGLKEHGYDIRFSRKDRIPSYYLQRTWSPAEVMILIDAVRDSFSLHKSASARITYQLKQLLSPYQQAQMPEGSEAVSKTDNAEVLPMISDLISAIASCRYVEFFYYDLSITRQKRYRRNKEAYRLLPVALMENNGRYYCVFYSKKYESFANYRIDKMSSLTVCEDTGEPIRFDAKRWRETSFQMYRGDAVTVSLQCDNSLIPIVFDQFGRDVLISHADETSFTVNLKTSLSPTLISWILMFYERIRVLGPDSLIEELRSIGKTLTKTYKTK